MDNTISSTPSSTTHSHNHSHAPPSREDVTSTDPCVICLSPITDRAICYPCNHLTFDFLCLVSWLDTRPACPLCNTPVDRIEYDYRSPTEYCSYRIPNPAIKQHGSASSSSATSPLPTSRNHHRWPRRPGPRHQPRHVPEPSALARRRRVYELAAMSAHVGTNRYSEHASFTPQSFSQNHTLQSRARLFLRREVSVFPFLNTARRREFLVEYVVAMLKKLEIKGADGKMVGLVGELIGRERAEGFCHEVGAWLRSPFNRLEDWDRAVQYQDAELAYGK